MALEPKFNALAYFFNDFIGAVVPGIVFFASLWLFHGNVLERFSPSGTEVGIVWQVCALAFVFTTGHILLAIHRAISPILTKLPYLKKESAFIATLGSEPSVKLLREQLAKDGFWGAQFLNAMSTIELRSVAMTVSREAQTLGQRFMFISLLCRGVATGFFIAVADAIFWRFIAPGKLLPFDPSWIFFLQIGIFLALAYALLIRTQEFFERAMRTPFGVAATELALKKNEDDLLSGRF